MATERTPVPRTVMIDRLMSEINGPAGDPNRPGYMSRERANETLDMFKAAQIIPYERTGPNEFQKMDAKKAAGYFSPSVPAADELARAKGRGLDE